MKQSIIIATMCALMCGSSYAVDTSDGGTNGMRGGRAGHMMMQNLTDEQQACIAQYGCEVPQPRDGGDKPADRPDDASRAPRSDKESRPDRGQRPEISEDQRANKDCLGQAMAACGIEMPAAPVHSAE